jgi:hypothetical protein
VNRIDDACAGPHFGRLVRLGVETGELPGGLKGGWQKSSADSAIEEARPDCIDPRVQEAQHGP